MSTRNNWVGNLVLSRGTWIAGLAVALVIALTTAGAYAAPAHSAVSPTGYSARALATQAEGELASGHPGPAILHFERARLLAPRSPAIAAGLARAQAAAALPAERVPLWQRLEHRLAPNEWAWIGMIGLIWVGFGLIAVAWGAVRRGALMVMLAGGVVCAGIGFVAAVQESPPVRRAIVVAPDVVARIAPFAQADTAFSAPEGSVVTVERTYGDYVLVAGPDGQGWVPRRGVETVIPSPERRL